MKKLLVSILWLKAYRAKAKTLSAKFCDVERTTLKTVNFYGCIC